MKKPTMVFFILFVMTVLAFAAKPRIAIVDFEDKSGSAYGNWAIGTGVSDMLATTLFKSGKFDLYERKQMEAILQEQNLQMSGAMTTESAVKVGKLLGVKFLVVGSVDQFGQKETGVKAFGIGVKSTTAHVACDVRLIEVETGKLVAAEQGEENSSATGISTNYDNLAFGSNGFDQTIIGKATNKCVADLADKISRGFRRQGPAGAPYQSRLQRPDIHKPRRRFRTQGRPGALRNQEGRGVGRSGYGRESGQRYRADRHGQGHRIEGQVQPRGDGRRRREGRRRRHGDGPGRQKIAVSSFRLRQRQEVALLPFFLSAGARGVAGSQPFFPHSLTKATPVQLSRTRPPFRRVNL